MFPQKRKEKRGYAYHRKYSCYTFLRTCYIQYMNTHIKKDSEIKIRISKKDKDTLVLKAQAENTTLTNLILKRCLKNDDNMTVSSIVSIWNSYNEIIQLINDSGHQQLADTVKESFQKYLPKPNKEI